MHYENWNRSPAQTCSTVELCIVIIKDHIPVGIFTNDFGKKASPLECPFEGRAPKADGGIDRHFREGRSSVFFEMAELLRKLVA